jgi:hypothetical protein
MTEEAHSSVHGVNGGAYGFRLRGVPEARHLLIEAPGHWPELMLRAKVHPGPDPPGDSVNADTATIALRAGGWVVVDRRAQTATFSLRKLPSDGALVHPHLASVAVVAAHWLGRDTFHAGAFVADDGVWGVLGEKGAGKSSLLAALALAHVPVLTDDVLVIDGGAALAGPRSIDLREGAAAALQTGEQLGRVGDRERFRLTLGPVAPELPLKGWVVLRWGDDTAVRSIRGADRLQTLGLHRGARLYPPDPARLIELSGLPFLELRRPQEWASSAGALAILLDAVA